MPTADRYAKYRSDQTTIWVSKTAATQLSREREAGESGASLRACWHAGHSRRGFRSAMISATGVP